MSDWTTGLKKANPTRREAPLETFLRVFGQNYNTGQDK